jgi:hypothetical protein
VVVAVKPRSKPKRRSRNAEMNAAVVLRRPSSTGLPPERTESRSRNPWPRGPSPVRIEAWEGPVRGTWAIAVSNRTPRAARASSTGVEADAWP